MVQLSDFEARKGQPGLTPVVGKVNISPSLLEEPQKAERIFLFFKKVRKHKQVKQKVSYMGIGIS